MQQIIPAQNVNWRNKGEVFLRDGDKFVKFSTGAKSSYFNETYTKATPDGSLGSCRQSLINYMYQSLIYIRDNGRNDREQKLSNALAAKIGDKTIYANGGIAIEVYASTSEKPINDPQTTIPLMDIIVGNTLVMVDQKDSEAVRERRKHFGFAGDFIKAGNSLEYRVPTNFWFRSPSLCSLVTGLIRTASNMSGHSSKGDKETDYLAAFNALVPQSDIIKAINNNDPELARKNFDKISTLLAYICSKDETNCENFFPITKTKLPYFYEFINQGMDYWFKDDLISNWEHYRTVQPYGIERFLEQTVKLDVGERKYKLHKLSFADIWEMAPKIELDKSKETINIDGLRMAV